MQKAALHVEHEKDHAGDIHRRIERGYFAIAARRKNLAAA